MDFEQGEVPTEVSRSQVADQQHRHATDTRTAAENTRTHHFDELGLSPLAYADRPGQRLAAAETNLRNLTSQLTATQDRISTLGREPAIRTLQPDASRSNTTPASATTNTRKTHKPKPPGQPETPQDQATSTNTSTTCPAPAPTTGSPADAYTRALRRRRRKFASQSGQEVATPLASRAAKPDRHPVRARGPADRARPASAAGARPIERRRSRSQDGEVKAAAGRGGDRQRLSFPSRVRSRENPQHGPWQGGVHNFSGERALTCAKTNAPPGGARLGGRSRRRCRAMMKRRNLGVAHS